MDSIFVEFIEIFINQVIYLRGVYPKQIFRKHKAYSVPVYCSFYPPLNDYLKLSLQTLEENNENKVINKVEIQIYNERRKESFIIEVIKELPTDENDKFLLSMNDMFRQALLELELKFKSLVRLESPKFKILLHTNEQGYNEINENAQQDFLWIKQEESIEDKKDLQSKNIIPIISLFSAKIYIIHT
ncbi:hypothetical protein PVAND_011869 [Polypedilum vanderplanki]|uniref:HORMA domain-containing protein n=1 Tax=Polypedilum vanderplanki TaxID=319348 RepID=A0A9J6CJW8_POLVA|nr:hypothetical protein PVAND_011869 [Polypedilum vanderplanki]